MLLSDLVQHRLVFRAFFLFWRKCHNRFLCPKSWRGKMLWLICPSVRASQFFMLLYLLNLNARVLKFHIWIPHLKIVTPIVSSTEPKDHKWAYSIPMVRRPSVRLSVHPSSKMLKHLLLRNRLANQSQFLYWISLARGNEICLRHLNHMTKMATMPIYSKNHSKIFFSGTSGHFHETWYVAS